MRILVTGNAGFIGFHTAKRLLERGDVVIGADVVNDYYDVALKEARLRLLETAAGSSVYRFIRGNLASPAVIEELLTYQPIDRVIHLAAQPGVRYSMENPAAYVESNLVGFANVLELCRRAGVPHLTYASTSSVYGANTAMPFSEHQGVAHPLQFYAATKMANELMAHSYSHLYRIPTTGLRFFTVYGPWGRPDMAFFRFTRNILEGRPIEVYNYGKHTRDFTYVDDVVEGILRASDHIAEPNPNWDPAHPDPATSSAPFRLLNIGNSRPVLLSDYIAALEEAIGKPAIKKLLPLQPGDALDTHADVSELTRLTGFRPTTPVAVGVARFVAWYREYYAV